MDRPERQTHPSFTPPAGNPRLWRYMDLSKYLQFLHSKTLWFARADCLGDPFEGSTPQAMDQAYKAILAEYEIESGADTGMKKLQETMYINCWHMNELESAAMWKLYSSGGDSVAITTTYERLSMVLPFWIQLGVVSYIDYRTEGFSGDNIFNRFVHKRRSFAHEQELRAVFWDTQTFGGHGEMPVQPKDDTPQEVERARLANLPFSEVNEVRREFGAAVPVEVERLVTGVFVNPSAPSWLADLIGELSAGFGVKATVSQSALRDEAIF